MGQLILDITKLWLPTTTKSYTPLAITVPARTSTNLNAPRVLPTARGPKSQPNFNLVVAFQLPCQFPIHWPTSFANMNCRSKNRLNTDVLIHVWFLVSL